MTRETTLCILLCDSFQAELDAVAACASYPDVTFATYPARCGRPPVDWGEIRQAAPQGSTSDLLAIGGPCIAQLQSPPDHSHRCIATGVDNCFRLFISRYALDSYLEEGAYLATSGWLAGWRRQMEQWGFDRDGAREFFAESCRKIVLLDTGVVPGVRRELEEFSEFVALPHQVVPVGLEHLNAHLERCLNDWRRRHEARQVSDYAIAFDLLGTITEMVDEEEVVRSILTFYGIVFGATDLAYVVMAEAEPVRVIRSDAHREVDDADLLRQAAELGSDHTILSRSGFLLAIRHDGKVIGVIRIEGIPLPLYRDQYLNLALSTAAVWGLALNNARSFQCIGEMTGRLRSQKQVLEAINTIFRGALRCGTDEDLGQTCLRVAEELTGSRFGFIGEIGADGLLHDLAISDPGWQLCTMHDQSGHRRPPGNFQIHGLYGCVLRTGSSVLTNAPSQHPESIGVPDGHPPLTAFLGVPLMEEHSVVGIIALGNRAGGYGPEELEAVESLAPAIVAAFRRRRAEEALQQANERLEERIAQRTRELADRESRRLEAERSLHEETLERLRVSEALREKERLLIQQSRLAALGEMINNIAHQWRQPLNAVGLVVQDLQLMHEFGELNKAGLDERVAKVMELLRHMSQTIDDFRNFFRPDKEKAQFSVAKVVAKTLSLVEESFQGLGIGVEVDASDAPVATGYPNEYAQVLLNILINARDAFSGRSAAGARSVRIAIARENERCVVTLSDNAGGIPDQIMGRIFDPYFTTKGPDQGTGVGLYMAKMIIEKNMSGRLSVRNTGEGAEFRIEV